MRVARGNGATPIGRCRRLWRHDLKHVVKATHRTQPTRKEAGARPARAMAAMAGAACSAAQDKFAKANVGDCADQVGPFLHFGDAPVVFVRSYSPVIKGGATKVLRESGQVGFIRISSVLTP